MERAAGRLTGTNTLARRVTAQASGQWSSRRMRAARVSVNGVAGGFRDRSVHTGRLSELMKSCSQRRRGRTR